MVFIYILKLTDNKYYIGKSYNPDIRISNHFENGGSYWTKKYKPVHVMHIIPGCDEYDEDKYTLIYMEKYGIDNVRGGSFCELEFSKDTLNTLNKMLNGSEDRCFKCGKNGHFAGDCKKNKSGFLNKLTTILGTVVEIFGKEKETDEYTVCYRCGRDNHYANRCYAKTDIDGFEL